MCDIWSCGVILYHLLSFRQPFAREEDVEIIESVELAKFDYSSQPFNSRLLSNSIVSSQPSKVCINKSG